MDKNSASLAEAERAPAVVSRRTRKRFLAAALLLLAFGLLVSSALRKSATVDEQSHLFRGIAYLRTGATQFLLGHPLLGGTLSAIPLLTEPDLQLPMDTPAWETGDWSVAGDAFLWQINEAPLRLIFLGRMPVIWLTLLLGALLYRWGSKWAGPVAGLLALGLIVLDPNVLAHGRLITGDLPLVLFFVLTLYGCWRWAGSFRQRPSQGLAFLKDDSVRYLLMAGVGLGLAGATKFNAAMLLPALAIWAGVLGRKRRSLSPLLALMVVGVTGWITIWVVYGFSLWRGFLPGGAFWDDVLWQLTYVGEQHGVYLLGESSPSGWWSYFPIAFGLKSPLVSLLLLGLALFFVIRQRAYWVGLFLLLPAAIYFAGSMIVALNIGYRYLLPVLPLLFLLIAVVLAKRLAASQRAGLWAAIVLGSYVFLAVWIWPDYLPYYNVLAGQDSWTILSDSNVDWGQDLPALRAWQQRNDGPLALSYFGTAHPSEYGLAFDPLPTWLPGPEQGDPAKQAFYPPDPAPGNYAISVTNLHGVVLGDERDTFAVFRDQAPLDRLGGSIFVYQVGARGEGVEATFSGLTPADLAPALHDHFGSNDVRVRWFDATTSFIWPEEGGWLATTSSQKPGTGALAALWPRVAAIALGDQQLYQLPAPPELGWDQGLAAFGDNLSLLGWKHADKRGERVSLLTAWRVDEATDRPLKLFVHALDSSGEIVGQWDGLDVDPGSWRPGDVFVQWHEFVLSGEGAAVKMAIGVYDGETLDRVGAPVVSTLHE